MIIYFLFLTIIFELMIIDKLFLLKKGNTFEFATNQKLRLDVWSNPSPKKFSFLTIVAIIIIYFFSAFRFNIGWDYWAYYESIEFNRLTNIVSSGEYLTIFLIDLAKVTGITNLYFAINSFICVALIFKTIKNYSVDHWLSILVFTCFPLFYLSSFSIIRFFTALALTFYGIKYIEKKSFFKYLVIVLLASSFHKSAFIALIFYFVGNIKLKTSKIVTILLLLPVAGKIINNLVINLFPRYSMYTQTSSIQEGQKAITFFIALGVIALIFRSRIIEKDSSANIYFNLYFLGLAIYLMFFSQGTMGHRLSLFGTIYSLLLIPKILLLFEQKDRMYLKFILYILLVLMFIFIVYIGAATYIPYRLIFFD